MLPTLANATYFSAHQFHSPPKRTFLLAQRTLITTCVPMVKSDRRGAAVDRWGVDTGEDFGAVELLPGFGRIFAVLVLVLLLLLLEVNDDRRAVTPTTTPAGADIVLNEKKNESY